MLTSFVTLQLMVEQIVVLGKDDRFDAFDWLRNSNYLSSFVHADRRSEIHLPIDINALKQRDEIACFVMTSPKNRLARSAIRRTWGKVIKPLFIMGLTDNETMRFVANEAKLFNDIIVEDFVDSYMNLTIKTAFAMKHFIRHFKNSKYFLKIDDDVLLNTDNLYNYLRNENPETNAIIGARGMAIKPHRDRESKWYVPHWLYGNESFPQYVDGPVYLIPGKFDGRRNICRNIILLFTLQTSLDPCLFITFLLIFSPMADV